VLEFKWLLLILTAVLARAEDSVPSWLGYVTVVETIGSGFLNFVVW